MKLLNLILLMVFTISCNLNKSNSQNDNSIKANPDNTKVRQYAESLLAGENNLSLETALLNLQIFDSINSPIDSTRTYYLHVAKFLIKRGDALLDGALGRNLIIFIKDRPREFIVSFFKSSDNDIRDVGLTIGAYISNHVSDKAKEANNIEEILSKNVQLNIPIEVSFKRKIMPVILSTIKAINQRE